ncbi:mRpS35 [Bugula neritina]|uniref:MRpS35 n=1 Tax=Bugula neritina TaxID=10212 RepID=A0A7J7IS93_BUGNE|nr:mRpS35 [Bugula neritina]
MIRLLGDRYNVETGEVTIQTDSCPSRLQNTDYAKYLLTALYFESWKVEDWESEITWADLKTYEYDKSSNKVKVEAIVEQLPHAKDDKWKKSSLKKYEEAISNLHNQGESQETLTQYKRAVMNLLKLKTDFQ